MFYILKNKTPVQVDSVLEWARFFDQTEARRVASDIIETPNGSVVISTVFLGIDYSLTGNPPFTFETMIFGGKEDGYCERYPTWESALVGHRIAIARVAGQAFGHSGMARRAADGIEGHHAGGEVMNLWDFGLEDVTSFGEIAFYGLVWLVEFRDHQKAIVLEDRGAENYVLTEDDELR